MTFSLNRRRLENSPHDTLIEILKRGYVTK
jgi:hypothetical protein